jgi:type IV pilus assembly protein PilB
MSTKKRLGEMLLEAGVIDEAMLQSALGHQRRWGGRLGQALLDLKLVSEAAIVEALARKSGIEVARLSELEPYALEQATKLVPREFAQRNNVFPMAADTSTITVAMSDPSNLSLTDELRFRTGRRVKVCIGGDREIAEAIRFHYPQEYQAPTAIALDIENTGGDGLPLADPFEGGSTEAMRAMLEPTRHAPPSPATPGTPPPPVASAAPALARPAVAPPSPAVASALPAQPPVVARSPAPAPAAPAPAATRPGPAAPQPTGSHPAVRPAATQPTGSQPAVRPAAPQPTGSHPAVRPAAAQPSGSQPAVRPAAPQPSGSQPAVRPAAPPPPAGPPPSLEAEAAARDALFGAIPRGGFAPEEPYEELTPAPADEGEPISADLLAPEEEMVEGRVPIRELSTEDVAILDALDRIARGAVEPASPVPTARLVAALLRLLVAKKLVSEQDLLDELARR